MLNESKLKALPLPAKIVLTTFLLSVGVGFSSALVNLHFQSADAGQVLPGPNETVAEFHGSGHPSQMIKLLTAHEGKAFNGSGSMKSAFTKRRAGGMAKALKDKKAELLEKAEQSFANDPKGFAAEKAKINSDGYAEKLVLEDLDGERLALLAWIQNGYKKEFYDNSEQQGFPLNGELLKLAITPKFVNKSEDGKLIFANIHGIIETRCVRCHDEGVGGIASSFPLNSYETFAAYCEEEKSDAKSLDKLALSSHVHLLGFATLYGLTGLCLAFSGYPIWLRGLIAPGALIFQVIEISCWWLARLEAPAGSFFASAIPPLGGIVAMCLLAQIVLSIWDMYESNGRKMIVTIFVLAFIIISIIGIKVVIPFLKEEKGKTIPTQSGGIKSAMTPRITPAEPSQTF